MTVLTAEASAKVKKPKPRERSVTGSRMMVQCVTLPNCSKYRRMLSVRFALHEKIRNAEE